MPKRKCSKKQLEALARGRAIRSAKLSKKTKATYDAIDMGEIIENGKKIHVYRTGPPKEKTSKQKSITDFFKAISTKKSTPFESKKDEPNKSPAQKILMDFFYSPNIGEQNYPLVKYNPPKKEEPKPEYPLVKFTPPIKIEAPRPPKREEPKINYPLVLYNQPKKKEEKKPGKSAKSLLNDLMGGAAMGNKFLSSLKLPEFATSKGQYEFENKLEKIIAEFRKGNKADRPKTKTIMYNGEVIEVPLDLLPDDNTIFEKNTRKYKNALVAAAALGALGYSSAKGIKYFKEYGAPILNSALDIIFKTAKVGGAVAKTTSKATSGLGSLFSTIADGFSGFINYFRNN